jgi:hypothetical protein
VPPEEVYRSAKVAFVGKIVERSEDRTVVDVERVYKGTVSGRVEYKGSGEGMGRSSCAVELAPGKRYGIMTAPGGDLVLCTTTTPEELERIAAPWRPHRSLACLYLWESLANAPA